MQFIIVTTHCLLEMAILIDKKKKLDRLHACLVHCVKAIESEGDIEEERE